MTGRFQKETRNVTDEYNPSLIAKVIPSVFFTSGCHVARRIDFRELVRDLFSLYKTRIWMQQLEPEMTQSVGTMQSTYSPQVHVMSMSNGSQSDEHLDMRMGMGGGPMI